MVSRFLAFFIATAGMGARAEDEPFKAFSWTGDAGLVLGGIICAQSGNPQWHWDRIHSGLGISIAENVFLRRSASSFQSEFMLAEAAWLRRCM